MINSTRILGTASLCTTPGLSVFIRVFGSADTHCRIACEITVRSLFTWRKVYSWWFNILCKYSIIFSVKLNFCLFSQKGIIPKMRVRRSLVQNPRWRHGKWTVIVYWTFEDFGNICFSKVFGTQNFFAKITLDKKAHFETSSSATHTWRYWKNPDHEPQSFAIENKEKRNFAEIKLFSGQIIIVIAT